jgi:NAD-reducing hydrogenase small subunit
VARLKFATVWLGGCSGCHMSFLDLDEWLITLAELADPVYSPIMDVKEFPPEVDVTLVEGAVANEENRHFLELVRQRTRFLVSFGDCAVTGNVTALRNPLGLATEVLYPVYRDRGDRNAAVPDDRVAVPVLLDKVLPLHQVVPVDFYLPGCPPPADRIRAVLEALVQGKKPVLEQDQRRFG